VRDCVVKCCSKGKIRAGLGCKFRKTARNHTKPQSRTRQNLCSFASPHFRSPEIDKARGRSIPPKQSTKQFTGGEPKKIDGSVACRDGRCFVILPTG
jgi:hypothetical protein